MDMLLSNVQLTYAWKLYREWRRPGQHWFDDRVWTRACASARVLVSEASDEVTAARALARLKNGKAGR